MTVALDLDHPLVKYSVRHRIIGYPAYERALQKIERLHQRALSSGHSGGLLITGLSSAGKTTVKREYESRFPRVDDGTITRIKVLGVDTPAAPTVKNLAESILIALGDPINHRGSAEEKTQRIYHLLRMCGVELLLVDEFQHFFEHGRRNEVNQITDWLKNFINNAEIPVVLFGLPQCQLVLRLNVQLARRFSSHYYLRPFRFGTVEEIQEFRGVLEVIERSLPIPSVPLNTVEMGRRFFCASHGLIDYVSKIIDGAIQIAYDREYLRLDERVYAEAFEEEIWRDAPAELNPFSASAQLRLLVKVGEPFAQMAAQLAANSGSSSTGHVRRQPKVLGGKA